MLTKTFHLACVWTTALCVLVQSIGAGAGGVLCVGCVNLSGGIGLADAPCSPVNDCCATHGKRQPSSTDTSGGDKGHACGCVDVTLSPDALALTKSPAKTLLSTAHFAVFPLVIAAAHGLPDAHPSWRGRTEPLIVRLLAPSVRQTVLRF